MSVWTNAQFAYFVLKLPHFFLGTNIRYLSRKRAREGEREKRERVEKRGKRENEQARAVTMTFQKHGKWYG